MLWFDLTQSINADKSPAEQSINSVAAAVEPSTCPLPFIITSPAGAGVASPFTMELPDTLIPSFDLIFPPNTSTSLANTRAVVLELPLKFKISSEEQEVAE